ncbi:hypothetical protein EDB19DRAFT_1675065 [Suillus lakei]|nr:hypothetical protein EDB19DRAFT_1675065 [Suillus lakei]
MDRTLSMCLHSALLTPFLLPTPMIPCYKWCFTAPLTCNQQGIDPTNHSSNMPVVLPMLIPGHLVRKMYISVPGKPPRTPNH